MVLGLTGCNYVLGPAVSERHALPLRSPAHQQKCIAASTPLGSGNRARLIVLLVVALQAQIGQNRCFWRRLVLIPRISSETSLNRRSSFSYSVV